MKVTDLPRLLPSDYGRAGYLREELKRAINYFRLHPNKAAKLTGFLAETLDIANAQLAGRVGATDAVVGTGHGSDADTLTQIDTTPGDGVVNP